MLMLLPLLLVSCADLRRVLARSGALRQNYFQLLPTSFVARKAFLSEALSNGSYLQPKDKTENEAPKNPFEAAGGMDNMMDGMKKQMVMMIPQTVIMGWINFFFSGFVLLKLPFPLTVRFKVMLQRGIETPDLDVTWVSSLSWYFLTLFGLNAVYRLVLGDDNGMSPSLPQIAHTYNRHSDRLEFVLPLSHFLSCRWNT